MWSEERWARELGKMAARKARHEKARAAKVAEREKRAARKLDKDEAKARAEAAESKKRERDLIRDRKVAKLLSTLDAETVFTLLIRYLRLEQTRREPIRSILYMLAENTNTGSHTLKTVGAGKLFQVLEELPYAVSAKEGSQ
jgi:flagellar hook-length control protein FliK